VSVGVNGCNTRRRAASCWDSNQRAREEGRGEGERAVLERQLRRRFGRLPPAISAQLGGASEADLEAWADRVLDAATLDDVFEPSRH
jgi:hypothetical protein